MGKSWASAGHASYPPAHSLPLCHVGRQAAGTPAPILDSRSAAVEDGPLPAGVVMHAGSGLGRAAIAGVPLSARSRAGKR